MFEKNLKYYRLRKNMSKKELASLVDVTPMAITNYENGYRKPNMQVIKKIAEVLDVRVTDFLSRRNENLIFHHKEFRKNNRLSVTQQEFVRESVEEYISRFYEIINILGEQVIPDTPLANQLSISGNPDIDALSLRNYLKISENGPIGNLIEVLENKGIIVYLCDVDQSSFSGMNGFVNERPYIIVNKNMSSERIRSTIAHEMVHFFFKWDQNMKEKEIETMATAIGAAFLFPKEDAIRELGIKRTRISNDMVYVCKEYGISMYLLVKRASLCHIISDKVAKDFYIKANSNGWKKNEPTRIPRETPTLFSQLVFRAVCEEEISVQKGAELLRITYDEMKIQNLEML